jgi:hypothetical protein
MLNLVLTLFSQEDEEDKELMNPFPGKDPRIYRRYLGKAKYNPIPITRIGQGRGGKISQMRRLLGLPLNPSAMPVAL